MHQQEDIGLRVPKFGTVWVRANAPVIAIPPRRTVAEKRVHRPGGEKEHRITSVIGMTSMVEPKLRARQQRPHHLLTRGIRPILAALHIANEGLHLLRTRRATQHRAN